MLRNTPKTSMLLRNAEVYRLLHHDLELRSSFYARCNNTTFFLFLKIYTVFFRLFYLFICHFLL